MTAELSSEQYLQLCQEPGYIIRNVTVNETRYKVDYDYASTDTTREQPAVSTVLGNKNQDNA